MRHSVGAVDEQHECRHWQLNGTRRLCRHTCRGTVPSPGAAMAHSWMSSSSSTSIPVFPARPLRHLRRLRENFDVVIVFCVWAVTSSLRLIPWFSCPDRHWQENYIGFRKRLEISNVRRESCCHPANTTVSMQLRCVWAGAGFPNPYFYQNLTVSFWATVGGGGLDDFWRPLTQFCS